ncbi:MAG: nitrilase-related carbon-nitrogen hydrolase, partial [Candidatus Saccharimonadaceae bacterium]
MKTLEFTRTNEYQPKSDFIRVASATPEVAVADVTTNTDRIEQLYIEAASEDVSLVVFPEMSITGYSIGDLVQGTKLLDQTVQSIVHLSQQTLDKNCAMVVGLPLRVGNAMYNCAALLADGEIKGVVPKQNLPTYKEFYEKRWYQ